VIKAPVYDPKKDGNVFFWVLKAAQVFRERRRIEVNATKEATTELKRLGNPEVEN
jgi:hypothetical protein